MAYINTQFRNLYALLFISGHLFFISGNFEKIDFVNFYGIHKYIIKKSICVIIRKWSTFGFSLFFINMTQ